MNNTEALAYIKTYFYEIFGKRNLASLDIFLDENYFDDDIGDPTVNHRENSKEYLANLFRDHPGMGVNVMDAMVHDNVIAAFLEWYLDVNDRQKVLRKGVAIFMLQGDKIVKRHTFVYFQEV